MSPSGNDTFSGIRGRKDPGEGHRTPADALVIADRLRGEYGIPTVRQMPPLEELVLTILSQNTNDVNRDRAWMELRERFPTWEDVLSAGTGDVEDAISVGGLAQAKASYIVGALQRIMDERGTLSLDFLSAMTPAEAREYLISMDGVGPKTAAIVLQFSLGVPAFPVDTHVHRVTKRLGLIGEKTSRERAHEILAGMFPEERYLEIHVNIIRHGRQVCNARRPHCPDCVLCDICPSCTE